MSHSRRPKLRERVNPIHALTAMLGTAAACIRMQRGRREASYFEAHPLKASISFADVLPLE